ncbi:hypothetical protein [Paractinoplanes lichenicola]|uniref:Uncharacterized protein n=1 Tax=Paractinoplanes lichenicola TaxID=2802976 RepID=A0ABS1VGT9_9ACTN|nr:hypothetical protein [Actinoplanes lichenicola]MBL7253927.1 hypothetical protein [Actinoplanes lichenicola]
MAKDYQQFRMGEERLAAEHKRTMDHRVWLTLLIAIGSNSLCLAALVVLSLTVRGDSLVPFVTITASGVVLAAISVSAALVMRRQSAAPAT